MKTRCWVPLLIVAVLSVISGCQKEALNTQSPIMTKEMKSAIDLSHFLSEPNPSAEVSLLEVKQILDVQSRKSKSRFAHLKKVKNSFTLFSPSGNPAIHVVNYEPSGYVLMSATRKHTPILASSDEGEIYKLDNNPVVEELITQYIRGIDEVRSWPDSLTSTAQIAWEMMSVRKPSSKSRSIHIGEEEAYRALNKALGGWMSEGYKIYTYGSFKENGRPESEANVNIDSSNKYWINESIRAEIDSAIAHYCNSQFNPDIYAFVLIGAESAYKSVGPLLTTEWHQEGDYSKFVPNKYPVGCVAVAMGQIMKYHRYPTSIDWGGMNDSSPTDITARFLYDVALEAKTSFEPQESTATAPNALNAFFHYGYTNASVANPLTKDIMKDEIVKHHRPVFIGAYLSPDSRIGHAFVGDGYRYFYDRYSIKVMALPNSQVGYNLKGYHCIYSADLGEQSGEFFHLNIGWKSKVNGDYLFSDFYGYNFDRAGIVNIIPNNH